MTKTATLTTKPAPKITTRRQRPSVVNVKAMRAEDDRNRSFKYTVRDLFLVGVSVAFIYTSVWLAWLAR